LLKRRSLEEALADLLVEYQRKPNLNWPDRSS
jgi:hypothetical protein